jgi:hypothetical protein
MAGELKQPMGELFGCEVGGAPDLGGQGHHHSRVMGAEFVGYVVKGGLDLGLLGGWAMRIAPWTRASTL